ncbi:ACT domain protein [Peptoniphilus sp. DNF00840]|jgi:hypothetical protein|nr:ACT domain protein [Peptoniphilus sp. DNF00840]
MVILFKGEIMRAVITVIGSDKIGIVYEVVKKMVEFDLNIVDITQTILDDCFTMIVIVDLTKMNVEFQEVVDAYEKLGKELDLSIRVQHQGIFDKMHQI